MAAPGEDGLESAVPTAPPSALGSSGRLILGIKNKKVKTNVENLEVSLEQCSGHFEKDPDPWIHILD